MLPLPSRIVYHYGEWQPAYEELTWLVEFIHGPPSTLPENGLLIIDDLMHQIESDPKIADLFTKGSHHHNCSIILLLQNLFTKGRIIRTISLNAHVLILMRNLRDKSQIYSLARQLEPGAHEGAHVGGRRSHPQGVDDP